MALVIADRVKETTTTTSTGAYTLAGATLGFQSFAAVGNGNTTYYVCTDNTDFEVGIGTFTASGTTLSRDTILESSNSDNPVDWSAGSKDVFVTVPAEKYLVRDASGNVSLTGNLTISGTVDGRDVSADGTKLDGIEASADVTDATNVAAAGALMDSEVTNLAQVKAFDSSDYATAAQGSTADAALPKAGGTMTGNLAVSAASPNIDVTDTGTSHASQDFLTNSNAVRATIGVERSAGGGLFVGSSPYAAVFGTASAGNTEFATNNNVRMTLDTSGNILVGTTSAQDFTSTTTNGHTFYGASVNAALHSRNNANALAVQRTGTDGSLVNFFQETTTVGSISSVSSSRLKVSSNDVQGYFFLNNGTANASNKLWLNGSLLAWDDSAYDIGSSSTKFKDIYLSGKIQLGGTGAEKLYVEGTNPRLYVKGDSNSYYPSIRLDGVNGGISLGTYFGGNISGTNGITFLTGSSATDSGTQRMTITASGSVGIGVAPSTKLHVKNGTNQNFNVFGPGVFSNGVTIASTTDGFTGYLEMEQRASQFAWHNGTTERMRLTSGGYLALGNTLIPTSGTAGVSLSPDGNVHCGVTGTSAADVARFDNANGRVGSITASGSATNYNTSSDYRLKENVVYDWDATTRLKQLKPARFNFISDAETTVDGFIAHEAQAVVPEAVMGTHNEVDDDGNAVMQGIDQAKLVPLLVKTIQELEARITALENA